MHGSFTYNAGTNTAFMERPSTQVIFVDRNVVHGAIHLLAVLVLHDRQLRLAQHLVQFPAVRRLTPS